MNSLTDTRALGLIDATSNFGRESVCAMALSIKTSKSADVFKIHPRRCTALKR